MLIRLGEFPFTCGPLQPPSCQMAVRRRQVP